MESFFLSSDDEFKEELVLKIAILAEKFSTDPLWYFNVILDVSNFGAFFFVKLTFFFSVDHQGRRVGSRRHLASRHSRRHQPPRGLPPSLDRTSLFYLVIHNLRTHLSVFPFLWNMFSSTGPAARVADRVEGAQSPCVEWENSASGG